MNVTGTSSVGLEPVDPFSATRVGNDTNSFVASSNDHNSNDHNSNDHNTNDDDEEDDNSSGDDDMQEFNERCSFNLSSIFIT